MKRATLIFVIGCLLVCVSAFAEEAEEEEVLFCGGDPVCCEAFAQAAIDQCMQYNIYYAQTQCMDRFWECEILLGSGPCVEWVQSCIWEFQQYAAMLCHGDGVAAYAYCMDAEE
jgi:hypothetical protein